MSCAAAAIPGANAPGTAAAERPAVAAKGAPAVVKGAAAVRAVVPAVAKGAPAVVKGAAAVRAVVPAVSAAGCVAAGVCADRRHQARLQPPIKAPTTWPSRFFGGKGWRT